MAQGTDRPKSMQVTQQAVSLNRPATPARSLLDDLVNATWRVPERYAPELLLPGVSTAFLMRTTGRCYTTIKRWQAEAEVILPQTQIVALMQSQSPADGLLMARVRGPCQMPFWSRLAAVEYRKRGYTVSEIADAFQCSRRAVFYVTRRTIATRPVRPLTQYQASPPSRKQKNFSRDRSGAI